MNIDTLNAYCGPVLVAGPSLCQGRFQLHPSGLLAGLHCPVLLPLQGAHALSGGHRVGLKLRPTSSNWCAWLWLDTRGFTAFVSCLPNQQLCWDPLSSGAGSTGKLPAANFWTQERGGLGARHRKNLFSLCLFLALSLSLSFSRPDIKEGYPPNLSILISGGKENNSDSLSNGE